MGGSDFCSFNLVPRVSLDKDPKNEVDALFVASSSTNHRAGAFVALWFSLDSRTVLFEGKGIQTEVLN